MNSVTYLDVSVEHVAVCKTCAQRTSLGVFDGPPEPSWFQLTDLRDQHMAETECQGEFKVLGLMTEPQELFAPRSVFKRKV